MFPHLDDKSTQPLLWISMFIGLALRRVKNHYCRFILLGREEGCTHHYYGSGYCWGVKTATQPLLWFRIWLRRVHTLLCGGSGLASTQLPLNY
jgi:hypothetical protein